MARRRYLKKTPLDEARRRLVDRLPATLLETEILEVDQALHRVTAEPVFARISSPHYHAAAMDGICLRAEDTFGATDFHPKRFKRSPLDNGLEEGFAYIDTGHPLPSWANAVIMIEKVQKIDESTAEIYEAVAPWHNVRLVGEDVVATELLLPRFHRLRPYDLGAVLAAGHTHLSVRVRPRVVIIPTGDELIEPGDDLRPGAVIEFNSTVLAAFVSEWGGRPFKAPKVGDDPGLIGRTLRSALRENHIAVLIAGSSAGERDFTAEVVEREGELLVHGIDVMPGKPAVLGIVDGKPVIGMPGYPVSAIVIAREILRPVIQSLLGSAAGKEPALHATLARKISSQLGLEELVRVSLGRVGEKLIAAPLPRGAGVITSMVRADGLMRIPPFSEGINEGEEVDVEILRSPGEIENTILCSGSHDLSISVLEDQLKLHAPQLKMAATNVGSLGGLFALGRGECHLAGTHLLDSATGTYNIPDIRRLIPDLPVVLVHLVRREQGLLVRSGNPKAIRGLPDLPRKDVAFVNRQSGSGTRVLLDFQLTRLEIDRRAIRGYEHEEFTHMSVGVAVASGLADAGLGVRSAANALGLDFVPVGEEEYDLLFLRSFFESERGAQVMSVIGSPGFLQTIAGLGGYDTRSTGTVVYRQ